MKISFLDRVLAPYAVPRFRALQASGLFDLQVVALGRSEVIREWRPPAPEFPCFEIAAGQRLEEVRARALRQALVRYLDHRNPDVLIVAGYGDRTLRTGLIWGMRRRKVVVLVSDSTEGDRPRFRWKEWLKSVLVRRCDAAFVSGERAAAYMSRLGMPAHRVWRFFDVVDNEFFVRRSEEERRREVQWRDRYGLPRRYFLYVGRFAPEKNLGRLLEAYGRYRDAAADGSWGLVLVGSGPERPALEGYVTGNRVPDVVWAGFQQIEELPAFYALASCLILPSVSEPWGLVVNEAMASGLPVLVSEWCGCVPELVHQGLNGYVFDPLDVDELARLMALMASDRVDLKAMGEESRRIVSPYSPETWARSLADCIQQASCGDVISSR